MELSGENPCFDFGVNDLFSTSDATDEEIRNFLVENKSQETVYKDKSCLNRISIFMRDELNPPENRKIWELPPDTLDRIFSQFYMTAKKIDKKCKGELYQPDTLSSYTQGWQRVLSDHNYGYDIRNDKEFEVSRKVLASRRKQLTHMGLGNKPNATRPLTDSEVDQLFEMGYFGTTSPLSLQRAMWWKMTTTFGYRARDESRKLCFGDVKLCEENGVEYLEWDKERGSKTRTGEKSHSHQRAFNPRAYATGDDQCPVKIYKTFVSKRPENSKTDDSPFFLAMIPNNRLQTDSRGNSCWYYNRPLGKNMLGEFLSKAAHTLNKSRVSTSRSKVANHSARKTSITSLLDHNVHPIQVSQLSGHKDPDSLKSYYTAPVSQQKHMSDIINRKQPATAAAATSDQALSLANTQSCNKVAENSTTSSFAGANISNCTFNITIHQHLPNN